jgi:hypothetical protein
MNKSMHCHVFYFYLQIRVNRASHLFCTGQFRMLEGALNHIHPHERSATTADCSS